MPLTTEQRLALIERWIASQKFHRHEWAAIVDPPDFGAGVYEPIGTAASAVSGHESTYGHLTPTQKTDLTDGGTTSLHSHAGGGGGVLYDTQTNRPAANTVADGTLFVPTDGYPLAISNGSAWQVFVDGYRCTNPPAVGDFTGINNGAETTFAADGDGLALSQMGTNLATALYVAYVKALPAAPYALTVGIDVAYLHPIAVSAFGIVLTDGTNPATSKVTDFLWNTTPNWVIAKMANMTAGHVAYTQGVPSFSMNTARMFLRLRDDNTNRYYEISNNGRNWGTIYSVGRTDYLTPTHGGLIIGQSTTAVATNVLRSQMNIFHWSLA